MCGLLLCSKLWIIVGLFLFFLFFLASPGCYIELVAVFFYSRHNGMLRSTACGFYIVRYNGMLC